MTEDEVNGGGTPVTALDATALRHARHEANMTQAQLAEALRVTLLTVEQWEWGTRPVPPSLVPAIFEALGQVSEPEEEPEPDAPPAESEADEEPAYDPTVVESLFEQVSATTARLQADVAEFLHRIEELEDVVDDSDRRGARLLDAASPERYEAILRETLLTAQKAAHDVREDARRTATLALRKARRRAARLLDEAERERARADEDAQALRHSAERTLAEAERARRTIEAELERLTRAAREEAERVLREAEHERRRITDEILELQRAAEGHREEIRSLLHSMLERVEPAEEEPHLAEVIFKHEMARRRAAAPPPDDES
jgi:cell division septum initiation protein DivIVA/DNA-binding XRE family transcriptional regulator